MPCNKLFQNTVFDAQWKLFGVPHIHHQRKYIRKTARTEATSALEHKQKTLSNEFRKGFRQIGYITQLIRNAFTYFFNSGCYLFEVLVRQH
jgi:hypothetical protein